MRRYYWLLFIFIFGCAKNPETYIKHLKGYWEIEKVIFTDGNQKTYKYNETVDYITFNDQLKGFRKKLNPSLNGNYITSKDVEALTLKIENNTVTLQYKTPYNSWEETVLEATETQLKVMNATETIYVYKRYTPINLSTE